MYLLRHKFSSWRDISILINHNIFCTRDASFHALCYVTPSVTQNLLISKLINRYCSSGYFREFKNARNNIIDLFLHIICGDIISRSVKSVALLTSFFHIQLKWYHTIKIIWSQIKNHKNICRKYHIQFIHVLYYHVFL